ncbi:MAG: enoyl-CoA hydratase/isomerase family protein, partial [Ilumatobacteraceae bacterium]
MTTPADAQVVLDVTSQMATIRLNSPDTRNALSSEFVTELLRAVELAAESDCRVIVLAHTPPVFCSGLDLKQVASGSID